MIDDPNRRDKDSIGTSGGSHQACDPATTGKSFVACATQDCIDRLLIIAQAQDLLQPAPME